MELDKNTVEFLNKHRDLLEQNDLTGFYNAAKTVPYGVALEFGKLFEQSGVRFEKEFSDGAIPEYFCYIPHYWVHGETLVVPSQIKTLHTSCFEISINMPDEYTPFRVLDARHVKSVYANIIDCTNCEEVIFGTELDFIDNKAFECAYDLRIIKIPESIFSNTSLIGALEDALEFNDNDIELETY